MKTDCKNASAGCARLEISVLGAIDQLGLALEQATAVLNLLCNDCFDGEPFRGGSAGAEWSLGLVASLLGEVMESLEVLEPVFPPAAGRRLRVLLERLCALVALLQHNISSTTTVRVFVALSLALNMAIQVHDDAFGCWKARTDISGPDVGGQDADPENTTHQAPLVLQEVAHE